MYDLGVRGVQATEIFVFNDMDNDFEELGYDWLASVIVVFIFIFIFIFIVNSLISEIYGFVYLFKVMGDVKNLYKSEEYTPVENPKNVYFANQVLSFFNGVAWFL